MLNVEKPFLSFQQGTDISENTVIILPKTLTSRFNHNDQEGDWILVNRAATSLLVVLLVLGTVATAEDLPPAVRTSSAVFIRADGSIDPPTAPISTLDNVTYTLIGNITVDASGIVIEKDSVKLDGAGYTLLGSGLETGIDVSNRENVTIENTRISEFYSGIFLNYSKNSRISENTITHNGYGILLVYSSNNVLRNNSMESNTYAFYVGGTSLSNYVNDVDSSNTVDGKPVYYWVDAHEKQMPLDAGCVCLVNCSGVTVQNLNLIGNGEGLMLAYTTGSLITQNHMTYDGDGIRLYSSNDNTIIANNMTTNRGNGILLWISCNNDISENELTSMWGNGIFLYNTSDGNRISENNMTANGYGMTVITSNNNSIFENSFTANSDHGIGLRYSNSNRLFQNNMTDNVYGIALEYSNDNTVLGNNVTANNWAGVWLIPLTMFCSEQQQITANNGEKNGVSFSSSSGNVLSGNNVSKTTIMASICTKFL